MSMAPFTMMPTTTMDMPNMNMAPFQMADFQQECTNLANAAPDYTAPSNLATASGYCWTYFVLQSGEGSSRHCEVYCVSPSGIYQPYKRSRHLGHCPRVLPPSSGWRYALYQTAAIMAGSTSAITCLGSTRRVPLVKFALQSREGSSRHDDVYCVSPCVSVHQPDRRSPRLHRPVQPGYR